MLVQSTAHKLNAMRIPTVLLKLDISKAFDSVQWSFLLEVMQHYATSGVWTTVEGVDLRYPCDLNNEDHGKWRPRGYYPQLQGAETW